MRLLVCGGRYYSDRDRLRSLLDRVLREKGISCIIDGGASGADTLASYWARSNGIRNERYYADWDKFGKRAGYLRNLWMLEEGMPDGVIAFPGGKGTENMISIARRAGVTVMALRT